MGILNRDETQENPPPHDSTTTDTRPGQWRCCSGMGSSSLCLSQVIFGVCAAIRRKVAVENRRSRRLPKVQRRLSRWLL
uniref:Uncharacterized protein n=1 Tax=Knipowitschia caucasica TaxID=637954 RepID=A0AAV2KHA7_KNICA